MRSLALNVPPPVMSVVLCTYNRSHLLVHGLDALLGQVRDTPPYEVIVVDNHSTDATGDVVGQFLASGIGRYEFEPRQGLSVARNRGVSVASADLIAFTDDDVRVSATWVRSIVEAFNDNSDADMVGGKVEPVWEEAPPAWLQEAGDAPLALVDFGEEAFRITPGRSVCLIGANVAVRRRAFERAGGFSIALQRVRNSIGSTEDYDFQVRVVADGDRALVRPSHRGSRSGAWRTAEEAVSPGMAQRPRALLCAHARLNVRTVAARHVPGRSGTCVSLRPS